jgi:hypothetical protein
MARDESDREDLLREATALVERVELEVGEGSGRIVAGFRSTGAFSIFFDADPVYQFNTAGELRRAYRDGLLYKADRGWLASLRRTRQASEVVLVRYDLSEAEQAEFISRMAREMIGFAARLKSQDYRIVGSIPPEYDVTGRIERWLDARANWPIANSPRAQSGSAQ